MYLKIGKIKQSEQDWGVISLITHIGLYSDEGKWIKWIAHTPEILQMLCDTKLQIPETLFTNQQEGD